MNILEGQESWFKRPRKLQKTTEMVWPCEENEREEHVVRRMLDVDIPGKRRRGRPNLRWKDACQRDIYDSGRVDR